MPNLTRNEILKLDAEQLNRAIWAARGWVILVDDGGSYLQHAISNKQSNELCMPDYANDIAAAYALEEGIQNLEFERYADILLGIVGVPAKLCGTVYFEIIHATALQRSQAWLIWHNEVS
jgi:hypothetical protein